MPTTWNPPWAVYDPNGEYIKRTKPARAKEGFRPVAVVDSAGEQLFHVGNGRAAVKLAAHIVKLVNMDAVKSATRKR